VADVYRIGVSIALANGVSPILAIIGRDMLGLHTSVGRIEAGFGRWSTAIGGAAAALGSTAMIGALVKVAGYGDKLLDQQDQLRRNGIAQNDVLKLQADYYDKIAKSVPTSTAAEYLKTVKELRAVTGSTEEAARLAPKALMVDSLLSNTFGHEMSGEYYKLLRSEEMKGISTDAAKREAFTDAAFSYITAFGGKLTARDYQTLARRGGAAFINMKPEAMGPLSVLAADLGGESTGTAMMTFQQLMTGANTMSKQQGQMFDQLGMLNMDKVTKTGFGGSRLQLGLGAIKGSQEYSGDQPGWIKNVLWPAIEKASGGDPAKREEIISKLAPNRNANKMIHMFGEAGFQDQIQKDLGLAGNVKLIKEAYGGLTTDNPKGVKKAFHDQFESMMQAVGAPMMQAALPIMKSVTEMFSKLGAFANANPTAIKYMGEALAAIGVALAAIGGIALASLIGIPVALTGLAVAVGTLVALNWGAVTAGVDSVKNAILGLFQFLFEVGFKMGEKLKGWFAPKDLDPGTKDFMEGLRHNQSLRQFSPGTGQPKATPITLKLDVDGRTMAQTMATAFDQLYEHATGAPSYDGSRRYIPADGGIMGT
jgi:hypothetical protein